MFRGSNSMMWNVSTVGKICGNDFIIILWVTMFYYLMELIDISTNCHFNVGTGKTNVYYMLLHWKRVDTLYNKIIFINNTNSSSWKLWIESFSIQVFSVNYILSFHAKTKYKYRGKHEYNNCTIVKHLFSAQ